MSRREPLEHLLKVAPVFFAEVRSGRKTQEFRSTDDRDFQVGDTLRLQEYVAEPKVASIDPSIQITSSGYTGQELVREITHVLDHAAFAPVPEGWAILSMTIPTIDHDDVERVKIGTVGRIDPLMVHKNALSPRELERLDAIVILGWLDNPRQLLYASSEGVADSVLLMHRSIKELLDRVEMDEELGVGE